MTRTWLPTASSIPIGGSQYKPVFKWHREESFRVVPRSKAYPSRTAAREAAEDYLAAAMNNGRCETGDASTGLADAIAGNVIAWRQSKQIEGETNAKVFGKIATGVIRQKGREIPVERRRRA